MRDRGPGMCFCIGTAGVTNTSRRGNSSGLPVWNTLKSHIEIWSNLRKMFKAVLKVKKGRQELQT